MNATHLVHTESTLWATDPDTGRLVPILNETQSAPAKWFISGPTMDAVRDLLATQIKKTKLPLLFITRQRPQ